MPPSASAVKPAAEEESKNLDSPDKEVTGPPQQIVRKPLPPSTMNVQRKSLEEIKLREVSIFSDKRKIGKGAFG